MRRYLPLILFAVPALAADGFDADAAGRVLAPFVDQQTIGVVRVEPRPADIDAWLQLAARVGLPDGETAGMKALKGFADAFGKAGGRELFVVISLDDVPSAPPMLVAPLAAGADEEDLRKALKAAHSGDVAKYGTALVAAMPRTHNRLKVGTASPRPEIATALAAAADAPVRAVLVPSADHRKVAGELLPKLPPTFGPDASKTVLRGVTWATFSASASPKFAATLTVKGEDAESARALAALAKTALGHVAALPGVKDLPGLDKSVAQLEPKANGDRVTLNIDEGSQAFVDAVAAAAGKMRQAAARSVGMNNLKQIALAWHNYHDATRKGFPAGRTSKDGKPLLSWRVQILPYLEQDTLYKQFHLDEPWDSEHNAKLIEKIPPTYKPTAQKVGGGKTTVLAPRGRGGDKNIALVGMLGARLKDITDGTSNTIMVVEASDALAVPWTKPDDFEVTEADPLKGLIGHYPEVFLAAFGDGSVRAISKTVEPKSLWASFTRNGGEVIPGGF